MYTTIFPLFHISFHISFHADARRCLRLMLLLSCRRFRYDVTYLLRFAITTSRHHGHAAFRRR